MRRTRLGPAVTTGYVDPNDERTSFDAFQEALEAWRGGARDRELGLHLMFLAWDCLCEPPHLTGFDADVFPEATLVEVFHEVHDTFRPGIEQDAEMLFCVGIMANLFPYLLGDEAKMTALSERYHVLYRALAPGGIPPQVFAGRGAFGEYFAEHARSTGTSAY